MKISPNVDRHPDGLIVEVSIPFPFPICITAFRNIEEARNFFEIRAGFIPSHPELYRAYYGAYKILEEAEFYFANLRYLCQIDKILIMQFEFYDSKTAEDFEENVHLL